MVRLAAALLAAAFVACAPEAARALHASAPDGPPALRVGGDGLSFSLGASVGMLDGAATELAYYYPHGSRYKLSELKWDLSQVAVAGLQASVGLGRRARFSLGYWSALNEGGGMMVDRDWLYSEDWAPFIEPTDRNWTDESRHPDTTVDKGRVVDLNLSVLALEYGAFSCSGIVGYRSDTWGWSARGGTFVYSFNSYRDTTGDFEQYYGADALVIEYEQRFTIPYVGVGVAWEAPALRVKGHFLVSGLVSATDRDNHVLRDVVFEGDFSRGAYLGLGVGAAWTFAPQWYATLDIAYQSIAENTGNVRKSGAEGDQAYASGGGIALETAMGSLGIARRF